MASLDEARVQLSIDLGDDFRSTTTSNGNGGGTTLVDTLLADEDVDNYFPSTKRTFIFLPGEDEQRRVNEAIGLTGSPVDTLTLISAFSTTPVATGQTYEVHRMFNQKEKEAAITDAVNKIWPHMFLPSKNTVTTVAAQMDYDVSAAGFFRNVVRQVRMVSTVDTEHEVTMFNWEMRHDTAAGVLKLHFYDQPIDARTLNIYGHKKMALADYTDGEDLLVLTAFAALNLVTRELAGAMATDRSWLKELQVQLQQEYLLRKADYRRESVPFTQTSKMVGRKRFSIFDIPS